MRIIQVVFVPILFFETGCAYLSNGLFQEIPVKSTPTGMTFTVDGSTYKTPAKVRCTRAMRHYLVFEDGAAIILEPAPFRNAAYYLNWAWIVCGVFPGVFGCIFDEVTGSAYQLFPRRVHNVKGRGVNNNRFFCAVNNMPSSSEEEASRPPKKE